MAAGTPTELLVPLFSILPVVLIASSTILLNRAMRYEKVLHRYQIQIWMWLALSVASLSGGSGNSNNTGANGISDNGASFQQRSICFAWAHLIVFFNLSSVLTDTVQGRAAASMTRKKAFVRNAISFLPIASWWSMSVTSVCFVLSTPVTENDPYIGINDDFVWKLSLWAFSAAVLANWLLRMSANRRRKMAIDLQGMPTTTTTNASCDGVHGGGRVSILGHLFGIRPRAALVDYSSSVASAGNSPSWLNERQWYTWTNLQTMQWFAQNLSTSSTKGDELVGDIYEEENSLVLERLAPHRITGDVLDCLADISQMVALGVPFGPACRLSDSIMDLIERHPKPQQRLGSNHVRRRGEINGRNRFNDDNDQMVHPELNPSNDCLGDHDREYRNEPRPPPTSGTPVQDNNRLLRQRLNASNAPMGLGGYQNGGIPEEQHERLNNVMKERFGLELPKLNANDLMDVHTGLLKQSKARSNDGMQQQHPPYAVDGSAGMAMVSGYAQDAAAPQAQRLGHLPQGSSSFIGDGNSTPSSGIPGNLLDEMPPGLREIAKRRPDLVAAILKEKGQQALQQQQQQQRGKSSTAPNFGTKHFNAMPSLSENTASKKSMTGEELEDFSDEEYDSDDQNETTSLIPVHKINEFPERYKSIDKSIIPRII